MRIPKDIAKCSRIAKQAENLSDSELVDTAGAYPEERAKKEVKQKQ